MKIKLNMIFEAEVQRQAKKLLTFNKEAKSFLQLVLEHKRRYNGNATVKDQFGLIKQKILL